MRTILLIRDNIIPGGGCFFTHIFPTCHEIRGLVDSDDIVIEGLAATVWVVGRGKPLWSKGVGFLQLVHVRKPCFTFWMDETEGGLEAIISFKGGRLPVLAWSRRHFIWSQ